MDEVPTSAGAPESFQLGDLVIDVTPRGLKAAGINRPSIVYVVRVALASNARTWTSSYGFPPREASARRAADAALDELDEAANNPDAWWRRVTEGMTPDEVEAMEDSPAVEQDRSAAAWVGPLLEAARPRRRTGGSWF